MRYTNDKSGITLQTKDGSEPLTNFGCHILRQIHRHDGPHVETDLVIQGEMYDGPLREILVPAEKFGTMQWVPAQWGVKPIIYPHQYTEVKTAIQETSSPSSIDVYTHTGWCDIDGQEVYLHAGGGISAAGNNPSITVDLPGDLKRYDLTAPAKPSKKALQTSLRLGALGPPEICITFLVATYRAALGDADFGLHLSGRTGTYKSELCSLWQSHYGSEMNARRLPGNWSSTAGSLEALAYRAKDALMVVDDFVPGGTAHHRSSLNRSADTLFRAQGNQAGRQRLTDTSNLQRTMYPRGLILSTGEDVPEGHSLRGRLIIAELSPGDISPDKLSIAQRNRDLLPQAMAGFIQWLAPRRKSLLPAFWSRSEQIRDANLGVGHARTPSILGQLVATMETLIRYGTDTGLMTTEDAEAFAAMALDAMSGAARAQTQYLTASDPCQAFVAALRHIFAVGFGHLRTRSGGIPVICRACGWTEIENAQSAYPTFKAHGPTLGWISDDGEEIFFDANTLPIVAKHSQGQIMLGPQTLIKRLKDGGLITRNESNRERNTIRVACGGLTRTVVAIRASEIFETK